MSELPGLPSTTQLPSYQVPLELNLDNIVKTCTVLCAQSWLMYPGTTVPGPVCFNIKFSAGNTSPYVDFSSFSFPEISPP